MRAVDVLGLIKRRHTTLEFSDKKLGKPKLKKILEAGRFSPSSHNSQDWVFIVVLNRKTIEKLLEVCTYGSFHTNPPAIIAMVADPIYSKQRGLLAGEVSRFANSHKYLNIGFAADHMLLTAESIGVRTAILSPDVRDSNRILGVKDGGETVLLIALGYEKHGAFRLKKTRKELGEVAKMGSYGGRAFA